MALRPFLPFCHYDTCSSTRNLSTVHVHEGLCRALRPEPRFDKSEPSPQKKDEAQQIPDDSEVQSVVAL